MHYPKLTSPRKREASLQGFAQVGAVALIKTFDPYLEKPEISSDQPKRKSLLCPEDNGTFVKPIKQSFVRNPRLMPMTRMMLTLLAGWNGKGQGAIKTTTGILAKHLSRSNRMVYNYLQDAMEEGYLTYSRIKDRMGYYIGIKITLNFGAIRKVYKPKHPQERQKNQETRDRKFTSEIKPNLINTKALDEQIMETLARFALKAGYLDNTVPKISPS